MSVSLPPSAPAEIDPLLVLHDALLAAGRETTLGARIGILVEAAASLGGAAMLVMHDDSMDVCDAMRAERGAPVERWAAGWLIRGAVWRRWFRLLQSRRGRSTTAAGTHVLELSDAWVRKEFGDALCGLTRDVIADATTGTEPTSLLLLSITAPGGLSAATLAVEVRDEWPPAPAIVCAVELIGQQLAQHVAEDRLSKVAAERAKRLQWLQDAGAALARSLDEREIVHELSRQVGRLLPGDGIVIAHPDVERGVVRTALRQVGGRSRARTDQPLGAGPLAEAARSGLTVRVDDYDPARSALAAADDVVGDAMPAGSVLAAPMRVGTQLVGVVAVHAAAPGAYRADHEELLRTVAAQAGTAIVNARLFAESEAERRQSDALTEVARAVGGSLRLGEVLRLILRHTSALLRAGGACVALQRDDYLHVVAGVGSASLLAGVHVPMNASMMGRTVREGRWHVSNDVRRDDAYYHPLQRIVHLEKAVLVPLVTADGPIGVIAAMNRDADFDEDDARVLRRLADHAAVAIVNARLFEEVTTATREWKVAFDAIAAGMAVLDEQGRIVRCNQRAAELTGALGPKALLGRGFIDAIGAEPEPASADAVARALEGGDAVRITLRAGSGTQWLDVVAAPHPDGGAVVTFDDVTAERARAAALERSEARYERLVESASDAIFTCDVDGRLTSVNHAMERATGVPRAALLGTPCQNLLEADERAAAPEMLAAIRRGECVRLEIRFRDPLGATRVGSVVATPVVEHGEVVGGLGVVRDVTDERRLAGQLMQRERLATVGRLVRGVAHELNNPLTSVLALAELLLVDESELPNGSPPGLDVDDRRDAALAIRAEAKRAARIIGRLHAFARTRAPEHAVTDLNGVLLDALDLRRHALRMQEVDIVVDLDYELPVTWADPAQLQQVFLHLISMAEHALASAPAARWLELRTRRDGERLEVVFRDSSTGRDPDAIARLLAPYAVGEAEGALAISSGIVREHGGCIRAESTDGGTAFVVELPFVPPPNLEAGPAMLVAQDV